MSGEARAADLLTRMRQVAIKQPLNQEVEAATVAQDMPPAARSFDVAEASASPSRLPGPSATPST